MCGSIGDGYGVVDGSIGDGMIMILQIQKSSTNISPEIMMMVMVVPPGTIGVSSSRGLKKV